ncbi:MAG TPA: hypothetical protein PK536_08095 [Ignavibacteria bacterium]|nr:hypothetical protein [Ignavibacteria bacterium]HRJ99734.1 hypothetical protein [Ignavibacteria bacterium]
MTNSRLPDTLSKNKFRQCSKKFTAPAPNLLRGSVCIFTAFIQPQQTGTPELRIRRFETGERIFISIMDI